jgi:ribosomal protein S24E
MKTREEMVNELFKIKIPAGLINYIAKKERSVLGAGTMNSLSKMNDQAIRSLYSAIIDDKEERDDYLLIRTTMWLVSEFQSAKISIDHPVPNIGDFRIVCLNEDDDIIVVVDCKMNQYEWNQIDEFISKLRILKEREMKLTNAFVVSRNTDASEIVNKLKDVQGMDSDGTFVTKEKKGLGGLVGGKPNKINFSMLIEKSKENHEKVFP